MGNYCRRLQDVAEALGLKSAGTIRRWRDELGLPLVRTSEGYDLDAIRAWARANVRMKADSALHGDSGPGDPDAEPGESIPESLEELRKRYMVACTAEKQAAGELRALKLEIEKGLYVPLSEVQDRDLARIAVVKSGLLTLPRRIAQEVEGLKAGQVEVKLMKAFRELLVRFSKI